MEKQNFLEYRNKINKVFGDCQDLDLLVPKSITPQTKKWYFFKELAYVIDWFLEQNESKEFFIQIPVDRLGDVKHHVQNFEAFNQVIARTLALHGVQRMKKLFEPEMTLDELVFINQEIQFGLVSDFRFFKCENHRFKELLKPNHPQPGRQYGRMILSLVDYKNQYGNRSVKLNYVPESARSNLRERIKNHIKGFLDFMEKSLKLTRHQYDKLAILGYNINTNDFVPLISRNIEQYLHSNIEHVTNSNHLAEDIDVLVVIGDLKYQQNNLVNIARNRLNDPSKPLKKVVYIGSELPEQGMLKYPFSYRELYYFFRDNDFAFPEHNVKSLSYEWAEEKKKELKNIMVEKAPDLLEHTNLVEHILAIFLNPFLAIEFDEEKAKKVYTQIEERLYDFYIENEMEINGDLFSAIDGWLEELMKNLPNCCEDNPKKNYFENTHNFLMCKNKNTIPRVKNSFKRRTRDWLNKNSGRDYFVFDSMSSNNFEAYQHMLRKGLIGKFTVLYYRGFENGGVSQLQRFLGKEINVYNDKLRKKITGISFPEEFEKDPNEAPNSMFEETINKIRAVEWNSSIYTVHFSEGVSSLITGNVIYENRLVRMDDLFDLWENRSQDEQFKIIYYNKPNSFDKVVEIYHDGLNVQQFAQLWKNKLAEIFQEKYDGIDLERLQKDLKSFGFRYVNQLPTYIENSENAPDFSNDMKSIIRFLLNYRKINTTESQQIWRAAKMNQENTKVGVALKDNLLHYQLSGNMGQLLEKVKEKGGEDFMKGLIQESLKQGMISRIE